MWDGYSDDDLDENKYSHKNTKLFNADENIRVVRYLLLRIQ